MRGFPSRRRFADRGEGDEEGVREPPYDRSSESEGAAGRGVRLGEGGLKDEGKC